MHVNVADAFMYIDIDIPPREGADQGKPIQL